MKESVMKKWVKALRSGKYKQGTGCLKTAGRNPSYCCLGVLCDLAPSCLGSFKNGTYLVKGADQPEDADTHLPPTVQEWAGMRSNGGDLDTSRPSLMSFNDGDVGVDQHTFDQIADIIEQNYRKL